MTTLAVLRSMAALPHERLKHLGQPGFDSAANASQKRPHVPVITQSSNLEWADCAAEAAGLLPVARWSTCTVERRAVGSSDAGQVGWATFCECFGATFDEAEVRGLG